MKRPDTPRRVATPLDADDFFSVTDHDYRSGAPIPAAHWHPHFELSMVDGGAGERTVGDSREAFATVDIVLAGPHLPHGWRHDAPPGRQVTIHFHDHGPQSPGAAKRIFSSIHTMLARGSRGLSFPVPAAEEIRGRILRLMDPRGFDTALEFLSLLEFLSRLAEARELAAPHYVPMTVPAPDPRIEAVLTFVEQNYAAQIRLPQAAAVAGLTPSAFSRLFLARRSQNFVDYLSDVRASYAARMLFATQQPVSAVCHQCGFPNAAHFIRVFKAKYGLTPTAFREFTRRTTLKY